MTDILSAAEVISRIPDLDLAAATYRALDVGLTNHTILVQAKERKLVLRLDTGHTELLGLNRSTELAILKQAAARGIAPDVVLADPDAGILVYEYLPGRTWLPSDLEKRSNLEAVAGLIRAVHALTKSGVAFDAKGAAERYAAVIRRNEALHSFARRCNEIIAGMPRVTDTVCCHNDIVAANIIAAPRLCLLDWEYACDNDPWFDVASLVAYHDLSAEHSAVLADAYSGSSARESRERLALQLRLYDALQWLWFAVRQTIEPERAQGERLRQLAERIG